MLGRLLRDETAWWMGEEGVLSTGPTWAKAREAGTLECLRVCRGCFSERVWAWDRVWGQGLVC